MENVIEEKIKIGKEKKNFRIRRGDRGWKVKKGNKKLKREEKEIKGKDGRTRPNEILHKPRMGGGRGLSIFKREERKKEIEFSKMFN